MSKRDDEIRQHMDILAHEALVGGTHALYDDLHYLCDEADRMGRANDDACGKIHRLEQEAEQLRAWIRACCLDRALRSGTCDGCPSDNCPLVPESLEVKP